MTQELDGMVKRGQDAKEKDRLGCEKKTLRCLAYKGNGKQWREAGKCGTSLYMMGGEGRFMAQ